MLLGPVLVAGQRLLNEQIEASTAARERIADLDGKRFAVAVRGSDLRFVAASEGGAISLEQSLEAPSDVELEAGAIDLIRLARSASLADIKSTSATLNGDIHVAEGFAELFRLAAPEPEAMLADWIGDIPAHLIGEAASRFGSWSARSERALEQNFSEYLQEENPTLVPPPLARRFTVEVDRIRDDVERAEKRVEALERRFRGKGS